MAGEFFYFLRRAARPMAVATVAPSLVFEAGTPTAAAAVASSSPALVWQAGDPELAAEGLRPTVAPSLVFEAGTPTAAGGPVALSVSAGSMVWDVEPPDATPGRVMMVAEPTLVWQAGQPEAVGGPSSAAAVAAGLVWTVGTPALAGAASAAVTTAAAMVWQAGTPAAADDADPCGPAEGFRLYDQASGELLATASTEARELVDVLGSLDLPAGGYVLGLGWSDGWGAETPAALRAVLAIRVGDGGAVELALTPAASVRSAALAEGYVLVRWTAALAEGYERAAAYEVATADDDAVIETVAAGRARTFEVAVGPFAHGATVRLRVRASDGEVDGTRGRWVAVPPVTADAAAPDVPEAVQLAAPKCGGA